MSRWPLVPLSRVLQLQRRWIKPHPTVTYREIGIRSFGNGIFHKAPVEGSNLGNKRVLRIEPGDLVFNNVFAWEGAVGVAGPEEAGMIGSHRFVTYSVNPGKSTARFLKLFFTSKPGIEVLMKASPGSAGRNKTLGLDRFITQSIPLPDLAEQRRLVDQIHDVAAKIGEATLLREKAVQEANTLLHALMNKCYEYHRATYAVVPLSSVCSSITDGTHLTPSFEDSGVKFIFVGNVSSCQLHFDGCKYVTPEYYATLAATRKPQRGDVLYSAVGATLGIPALVNSDDDFCFQRHIAIIKPNLDHLVPQYLWYTLRSKTLFRLAWSSITGTAQPTVPLKAIKQFPIPVAPLEEQRRVCAHLESADARVSELLKSQDAISRELKALLPSILNEAFKGNL